MAFSKTTWTWIIVVAIILIIVAIVIYLFRCSIFSGLSSCVEDPNNAGIPIPPGSPSVKWVPEVPPYNVGMFGPKIKALQKALGFSVIDQDGKLGSDTRAAIIAKGYAVPLSDADYNKIIGNPAPPATKKTIDDYVGTFIKSGNIDGVIVRYIADNSEFKKYGKNANIGTLGNSVGTGYHKIFDVAGDSSLQGLKISDQYLKAILGL